MVTPRQAVNGRTDRVSCRRALALFTYRRNHIRGDVGILAAVRAEVKRFSELRAIGPLSYGNGCLPAPELLIIQGFTVCLCGHRLRSTATESAAEQGESLVLDERGRPNLSNQTELPLHRSIANREVGRDFGDRVTFDARAGNGL